MKKQHLTPGLLLSLIACSFGAAQAQSIEEVGVNQSPNIATTYSLPNVVPKAGGMIVTPASSVPPVTQGTTKKTRIMTTDLQVYVPAGWKPDEVNPPGPYYTPTPPFTGYAYETPASLSCIYDLLTVTAGCNPNTVTAPPTGGSKSIAIVDAYDDPFAGPDLAYYSSQFGLPFDPALLHVVYEDGIEPAVDPTGGWEMEESLDLQSAHAMAPGATIYLVEAQSPAFADLETAVEIASNLVRCGHTEQSLTTYVVGTCPTTSTGTGEVSMSWGSSEFSTETSYDSAFTTTGVVYVASSGDSPGTTWPCASPNVVCAGGTTIRRNPSTGSFINEASWDLAGGGISLYEKIPGYQSSISTIVGTARGVPDVALDSNPVTGLWIYDSFGYALSFYDEALANAGWEIVGGTSAASPLWAGILNNAATRGSSFAASTNAELTKMYTNKAVTTDFRDVVAGFCGPYDGYTTATGWDPCTGIGSDQTYAGK
jgi:subtilase family serine protease